MSDADTLEKNSHIARAIKQVGRQADLARLIGCAQQHVSKLLNNEISVSAEIAVAIDQATAGKISKTDLRPDLWPRRRKPAAHPSEAAA